MDQIIDHSTIEKRSGLRARRPAQGPGSSRDGSVVSAARLPRSSYYKSGQAVAPQVAVPSVTDKQASATRCRHAAWDSWTVFRNRPRRVARSVGGTLTEIHFQDGQIVHKGDLLFVIDPRPYEIRLARRAPSFKTATARVALANSQLARAQSLRRNDFGTQETVDNASTNVMRRKPRSKMPRRASRDARLDLEYCRVTAPFTGRIGAARSRSAAWSPAAGRPSEPDNPAGDARLARSDLSRFRHERVGLSDLFTGTRPPSRSARRQDRHRPER